MPDVIHGFFQALPAPWIGYVVGLFFIADGLALIVMGRHMMSRAKEGAQNAQKGPDQDASNTAAKALIKANQVAKVFNIAAIISVLIGLAIVLLTKANT